MAVFKGGIPNPRRKYNVQVVYMFVPPFTAFFQVVIHIYKTRSQPNHAESLCMPCPVITLQLLLPLRAPLHPLIASFTESKQPFPLQRPWPWPAAPLAPASS